jgi:hypothetical protein
LLKDVADHYRQYDDIDEHHHRRLRHLGNNRFSLCVIMLQLNHLSQRKPQQLIYQLQNDTNYDVYHTS